MNAKDRPRAKVIRMGIQQMKGVDGLIARKRLFIAFAYFTR
jgi:hypothetical protein